MLIHLPNRSNGATVPPPAKESPKPSAPAAVPANRAPNSNSTSPVAKQATHSLPPPSASPASSPLPVALVNQRPSSVRSMVIPGETSAPATTTPAEASAPPTTTLAPSPPPNTTPTPMSAGSAPTGLASTTSALESKTPGTPSDATPSLQHTSTGVMVSIGLSGVVIVLILMVLIRFFFKRLRKKRAAKQQGGREDSLIVIPSTAFLDHPKNQEMGGVGASPAPLMDRSASFRSDRSFKPQHHHDIHIVSNHHVAQHPQPEMEFLHCMGTPVSRPPAWDGSRPSLSQNRSFY